MKSSEKAYTLYILQCSDGTYYTGIAIDVEKRVIEHNTSDKGAKYTRARRPVTLMYREICSDKSSALKRELAIKKMKRTAKEGLWICG
jgi:putative endonuclease